MRQYRCRVLIATLFALVFVARPHAFEYPSSHAMSTGGITVLSHPSPTDIVANPGLPMPEYSLGSEFGYVQQYDLRDLDRLFLVGAAKYKSFTGGIGLAQLGKSELYSEKLIKGTLSYLVKDFCIGGSVSFLQVEFGGNYGRFTSATMGAGVGYTRGPFRAHLSGDNLTAPKLFSSADPYQRVGKAVFEWETPRHLSTLVQATKTEKEQVRYGIGQRIPLKAGSALYWGVSTRPLEYGGGVDIGARWFTLTYAAKIHPVLGFSQTVSVSILKRQKAHEAGEVEIK